jgi:hypothetical protein
MSSTQKESIISTPAHLMKQNYLFIYLFIYLFVVYVMPLSVMSFKWVVHNELKRIWKEVVMTWFKVLFWTEHVRNKKENLSETQDISVSSEFQAAVHPKYNWKTFSLEITYSVANNDLKLYMKLIHRMFNAVLETKIKDNAFMSWCSAGHMFEVQPHNSVEFTSSSSSVSMSFPNQNCLCLFHMLHAPPISPW